jgi:hypothetical protein
MQPWRCRWGAQFQRLNVSSRNRGGEPDSDHDGSYGSSDLGCLGNQCDLYSDSLGSRRYWNSHRHSDLQQWHYSARHGDAKWWDRELQHHCVARRERFGNCQLWREQHIRSVGLGCGDGCYHRTPTTRFQCRGESCNADRRAGEQWNLDHHCYASERFQFGGHLRLHGIAKRLYLHLQSCLDYPERDQRNHYFGNDLDYRDERLTSASVDVSSRHTQLCACVARAWSAPGSLESAQETSRFEEMVGNGNSRGGDGLRDWCLRGQFDVR